MANYTKHTILFALLLTTFCSCARKTYQSVTQTADTLLHTQADSTIHRDTIHTQSHQATTDSLIHREQTILLLDSTGKVLLRAIYQDHTHTHVTHTTQSATTHTTTATTQAQKAQQTKATATTATTQQHHLTTPLRTPLLTALFLLIALSILFAIIHRQK